jgi:hypothetical protein
MTSRIESPVMGTGSMRLRGRDSWQLRVYLGTDPATGRSRWLSKTVHGTRRFARQQLEDLVAEAGRARIRAGTLAELLDQWIETASPGWSASTVSHTRSIVECHLKPHLDHLDLAKLTTANDLPPQSATSDSRWREGDGPGCQLPMIGSKVRGLGPWAVR